VPDTKGGDVRIARKHACRICKERFSSSDMHVIKYPYVGHQNVCIECVQVTADFLAGWNRKVAEARARLEAA